MVKKRKRNWKFTDPAFGGGFVGGGFDEDVMYAGVPYGEADIIYPGDRTEEDFDRGTAYIGSLGIIGAVVLAIGVFAYMKNRPQE